jgi:hypothetical protein
MRPRRNLKDLPGRNMRRNQGIHMPRLFIRQLLQSIQMVRKQLKQTGCQTKFGSCSLATGDENAVLALKTLDTKQKRDFANGSPDYTYLPFPRATVVASTTTSIVTLSATTNSGVSTSTVYADVTVTTTATPEPGGVMTTTTITTDTTSDFSTVLELTTSVATLQTDTTQCLSVTATQDSAVTGHVTDCPTAAVSLLPSAA